MNIFERIESNVRGYCRNFPAKFSKAQGALLIDEDGNEYIDFFSGAGALNYGHNPPELKQALIDYLVNDGIVHSLDMHTTAKETFLRTFDEVILQPRNLDYKIMFPGPTGTNAVETALKLARKVTQRHHVVSFTNGFHGMTLGALALTGNSGKRAGAGVPLHNVTHMPYCDYLGSEADTLGALERYLEDSSSGLDLPAAFILETVQAEGGVNVATRSWLQRLEELAAEYKVLLIVDDIQVGCGRTGPFFSFEPYGLTPDIVCLSKSLSGYGLPFAITMMKPELDVFDPGEHNGTFRGHNPAFVTAAAAIDHFWRDDRLTRKINSDAKRIRNVMLDCAAEFDGEVRGRGMIQGLQLEQADAASRISQAAYDRGMIIETAGPQDEVLKALPPLTISEAELDRGLEILEASIREVMSSEVAVVG